MTVTGAGSSWTSSGDLQVGRDGNGTLTATDKGVVEAGSFSVAVNAGSTGTINIGAASGEDAQAAGALQGADGAVAVIEFGAGDGTIVLNHTETDYEFDATVSGDGLFKQEAGNTHLTGDWSGFTGTGEISGGMLSIDTDFRGSLSVLSGGTLAGEGSIDGDADFDAGSTLLVDLDADDILDVSGTVTIDEDAHVAFAGSRTLDFELGISTTIMTAGEIDGEFDSVIEDLLFLDIALAYTPTTIDLTPERNGLAFSDVTDTRTQAAIADAVESLDWGNPLYDEFLFMNNRDQVIEGTIWLSGEAHASIQTSAIQSAGMVRDIITWRLRSSLAVDNADVVSMDSMTGNLAQLAYAGDEGTPAGVDGTTTGSIGTASGHAVWSKAYGAMGKTLGSGESHTTERSTGGLLTGVEIGYGSDWRLGGFLGYSHTQTNVGELESKSGMDSFTAGLYAARRYEALRLMYGAAVSVNEIGTERNVRFSSIDETLTADYRSATVQAFGEVGYALTNQNGFLIEPFAGAALVYQYTSGFTETGGASALTGAWASRMLPVTTLGLRSTFDLGRLYGGTGVSLASSVAWNHTFGDITPATTMTFGSTNTSFTVPGNAAARDVGLVGVGLNFAVTPDMPITIDYTGAFAPDQEDHALSAGVNARF
ncbi:autotransporter domain-containing protein [Pseudohoeflea suaedae]|uniref:autotransporter family protein n=1 Tax=Pseudohoeflea suaedae TaxID=877384 RepID=UPI001FCED56D|nr:autotransporter domain-containing protein [Pseudohoeflea suaedae]